MKNRHTIRYALFTILFIFIFTIIMLSGVAKVSASMVVNTYTDDFSVTSHYAENLNVCSCENHIEDVTVTNTGNFMTSYKVSLLAEQEWYSLSKKSFSLSPGESASFVVYAQPPCGTIGSYSFSVKILSSYGREKILTKNLDVRKCQNLFLTVKREKNESNLCQSNIYNVKIKNVAEFADTYTLDLGSFNDYATYSGKGAKETYLLPDEERTFNISITPPCSLYGDITIPFTISSKKNKVSQEVDEHLKIENQFDHKISVGTSEKICSRLPSTYTFSVKNLINVSNDYDVMVTGAGFMSYDEKSIHLDGLEAKNITLHFDPKKGSEGEYNIKVRVVSKLGDIKKERTFKLNVQDCFLFHVAFVNLPKDKDTACCGEKSYNLNIRNDGDSEEVYNLNIEGPSWLHPEETSIRLKPSENRNVKLIADIPCADISNDFVITASLVRHPEISESTSLHIDGQTQQTCHAVGTGTSEVTLDEEKSFIPFIVSEDGIAGGTFDVTLKGELFNGTTESAITLEPGEEKVLHLQTKDNITDYFDGKYDNSVTLTERDQKLTYTLPFWVNFHHVSWLTTTWRRVINFNYGNIPLCFWSALLLVLVIIAMIILLIIFRRRSWEVSTMNIFVVRTIIVALLLAVLLTVALIPMPNRVALYQQKINDSSGLIFQWHENEAFHIDLSKYFKDPDLDALTFSASQPAHIAVSFDGAVATLVPECNWAGNDKIVFTASDGEAVTDSPILGLIVLQRHHLNLFQWFERYCIQTILILFALLLVLLLLGTLLFKQRTRRASLGKRGEGADRRVIHTVVTKSGLVRPLKQSSKSVKRSRSSNGVKSSRVSSIKKNNRSRDALFVAFSEEHELRYILNHFKKRSTKSNIKKLITAGRYFKRNKQYKPHNRKNFYRYIKEKRILRRLDNKH